MLRITTRPLQPGVDLEQIVAIEAASFDQPWIRTQFKATFRENNFYGIVAEYRGKVIGFILLSLQAFAIEIVDLAVAPRWRRHGVGSTLLAQVTIIMARNKRFQCALATVKESNVNAQLFFRRNMYRCVKIIPEAYGDSQDDAYLFEYRLENECSGKGATVAQAAAWVDDMGDVWQGPHEGVEGPYKWARFEGVGPTGQALWVLVLAERGARWAPMTAEQLKKFLTQWGVTQ